MRLTLRLLGAELLDLDLRLDTRPLAAPPPAPCRFERAEPAPAPERPKLEASGFGEFGFGARTPGHGAYLPDGERPDVT